MDLVEYEPTEIIKISAGDLTVPVQTGVELSKLSTVMKNILVELLKDVHRDEETKSLIIPPETLAWIKEFRALMKDINEMTGGLQEKAALKQMDIVGELYKKVVKDMDPQSIIKVIRNIEDAR